jgi:ribosomal 30S subunit maturation factor RimM
MAVRPEQDEGEREILIPFVYGEFVLEVDLDGGVIDVDWEWSQA